MKPTEYAVCEPTSFGQIAYVLEHFVPRQGDGWVGGLRHRPAGNLHHIDGCVAVYRLVRCRPGAFTEAKE